MTRRILSIWVLLLLAISGPVAGADSLRPGGVARAIEIVDGDTLVLDNGRQVRLVGIQAPKLPLGRPNFPEWPLAREARDALAEIAEGRVLRLSYGGRREDRHGRLLAHLHDRDGLWLQGEMLRRGMARVYSFSDNRALVGDMLAREREARRAERGIWAHPFYRIRDHADAGRFVDSFQLVEGRVHAIGRARSTTFLNFGANWRRDFTISINGEALRIFREADISPAGYEGRRVRVRGWLKWRNGPMIQVSHPEQIEVLNE